MTQLLQETKLSIKAWNRCISLAQNCTNMLQLKAIHANFTLSGISTNTFALTKLLEFCALSPHGSLSYASLLFDQIKIPNSFVFNTLIRAYTRSSNPYLALHYFNTMLKDFHLKPQNHTFHFVLFACGNVNWVCFGRQIHCWVCKNGMVVSDGHIQTGVVRLYAKCRIMSDAHKVFDEIPQPVVVQWNVLMNGYVDCNLESAALRVFRCMFVRGVEPDAFCVTSALAACAKSGALWQGKWIHEYIKKNLLEFDVFIGTALVDMYAKCGCINTAVEVFEMMPKRNAFSWAAMTGGFAMHGYARKAIHCLERMQSEDGVRPDRVVLLAVLTACTHAGLQEEGRFLLDNMKARYGIVPRHEHYSCVVDLLCRAGRWDEAIALIKRMPMKPLASVWGAVLSSCRTHKNVELAELAVKELLQLENGNMDEEDAAFVQLSNIYSSLGRGKDASKIHRVIGDKGLKKTPGCSMIEVDGRVNEFVSGDVSHKELAQIHVILELLLPDLISLSDQ
ncbi:putative pentatricopeptide repeat-containing protein At3g28640 [Mercurialis annua]|uniref:putative pentatricopeptide repeat-containing protein At3g28640 n=1 Tax=Mercurialis annua TaxID=3986 RepID=UPI00216086D9|nr:putative pentatricopeptide repeat-containing protein At3g28640 [Mercurialis annua]